MVMLGERLKQARKRVGLSQKMLGELLGISQQHVAKWENNENTPATEQIARLAQALSCTTDWLLGLVDSPQKQLLETSLADDERLLLELYRSGRLPAAVERLIREMGRRKAEDDLIEQQGDQSNVS